MLKHVYTMTVVNGNPCVKTSLRTRCWGYYFRKEDAAKAIEENRTDMFEAHYYRYAVLQRVPEGPLAIPEEIQWYEAVPTASGASKYGITVKKISRPKIYRTILFLS